MQAYRLERDFYPVLFADAQWGLGESAYTPSWPRQPAGTAGWRPAGAAFSQECDVSSQPPQLITTRTLAKPDLVFVRSLRARHYRLTLRKDGVAVATVPARGSEREARLFVEKQGDWLARAWELAAATGAGLDRKSVV